MKTEFLKDKLTHAFFLKDKWMRSIAKREKKGGPK
jgi:hypothetical protein